MLRCVGVFGWIVLVAEGPLVAAISDINQLNDNFEHETQYFKLFMMTSHISVAENISSLQKHL